MYVLFAVISLAAITLSRTTFFLMLKRVKWLLLMMFIIYSYSTPGEYFYYWPTDTRPTYDGLLLAFMQAIRLITMLAALSCVLGSTARRALIGGLYQLGQPLEWLKLDAKRFALRVGLTLDYVETQQDNRQHHIAWRNLMSEISTEINSIDMPTKLADVVIEVEPMRKSDIGLMMVVIVILAWVLY